LHGKDASEEKTSIETYKKEHADYWKEILGSGGEYKLEEDVESLSDLL
jgi:hypothetical protein